MRSWRGWSSSSRPTARPGHRPAREQHRRWTTVRKELENRIRWSEYVKAKATDAELRRYVAANRDLFSGTQVRASHILLKVDPDAPAAEKEKVKQKLLAIKSQIDANKMTFAEAANKYSEDPANAGGAGGDLDYFTLSSGFIPEFTDVAFKLKKGSISEPVETPYGYHLIQVTDRKEGRPVDFEQNKPLHPQRLRRRASEEPADRGAKAGQDRHQAHAQGPLPAGRSGHSGPGHDQGRGPGDQAGDVTARLATFLFSTRGTR